MAKFSHILRVSSFAPDSGSFASLPTMRCTSSRNLKSKVGSLIIKRVQVIVSTLEEWFLVSGPRFNPSTMLLTGFVLGCPEFNSLAVLCRKPNGVPPASLDLKNTMFNCNICSNLFVMAAKPRWGKVNYYTCIQIHPKYILILSCDNIIFDAITLICVCLFSR